MKKERWNRFWKKYGYYGALLTGVAAFVFFIGMYSSRQQNSTNDSQTIDLNENNQIAQQKQKEEKTKEAGASVASVKETTEKTTELVTTEIATTVTQPSETETVAKTKTTEESQAKTDKQNQQAQEFDASQKYQWPVRGNVLLPYSMDTTVYYQTLDAYKVNPGIVIQAKENEKVICAATGKVEAIEEKTVYGTMITLDVGNGYRMMYGQLDNKSLSVKKGQLVSAGEQIGIVAAPSVSFSSEGPNLYFAVTKNGKEINPVELLK